MNLNFQPNLTGSICFEFKIEISTKFYLVFFFSKNIFGITNNLGTTEGATVGDLLTATILDIAPHPDEEPEYIEEKNLKFGGHFDY